METDLGQVFANSVGNIMLLVLVIALIFAAICVWQMILLIAREMMNNQKQPPRP